MRINRCAKAFPALNEKWLLLDGPGGTQIPFKVIEAISKQYCKGVANFHGPFKLSHQMDKLEQNCREKLSDFLGAPDPDEIHFGANMTSLSFQLAHNLAKEWKAGDNIILTRLDHNANVAPFLIEAQKKGVQIKWLNVTKNTNLSLTEFSELIDVNTVFVSLPGAANATGSIINIRPFAKLCQQNFALLHVDAVHLAPHANISVQKMQCDMLTCSAYKFYCPHLGIQWIKKSIRDRMNPLKLFTSPNHEPHRFQLGTPNPSAFAGVIAGLQFIHSLSSEKNDSETVHGMAAVKTHEENLSVEFLNRLSKLKQFKLYGETQPRKRTPTFALVHRDRSAASCSEILAKHQISSWHGHFYAQDLVETLDLSERGGFLRLGFSIYHNTEDVKRVIRVLKKLL